MKKSGYYAGPGPGVGAFTDTTAALRLYLKTHGDHMVFVDLYEFRLLTLGTVTPATGAVAGLVLRMAQADYDVPFEGVLYRGGGANRGWRLSRRSVKSEIGTSVAELEVALALDGADVLPPADGNPTTSQLGLGEAVHGGIFDGAHVLLRRLILSNHPTYPLSHPLALRPVVAEFYGTAHVIEHLESIGPGDTSLGAVTMFAGQMTEAEITRSWATLKIKSYLEKLAIQMPRNHYQTTCLNTLYDAMCGVSRTGTSPGGVPFQEIVTITSVPSASVLEIPSTAPGDWYSDGTMQIYGGELSGLSIPIEFSIAESPTHLFIVLLSPPPRLLHAGDTVILQAGCDKVGLLRDPSDGTITVSTCGTKFNNIERFRGMPHVPPPDTAY